jgi:hypothetical protein
MAAILFTLLFSWNLLGAPPTGGEGKNLPRFQDYLLSASYDGKIHISVRTTFSFNHASIGLSPRSKFLYASDMNCLGGGVKCPGNLHYLAHVWLNPILIVQLISCLRSRIVENTLTWRFGEVRPVEHASLLFRDAFDCLHRRLDTVQVLVGDFAFERGALSGGELGHR